MKVAPLGLLGLLMVACGGPPPPDADAPKAETPKYSYKGTWKEETTTLPTTYIFDDSTWRGLRPKIKTLICLRYRRK